MMVYKGILRYIDYRKIQLNMIQKGWEFITQDDRHPPYHFPRNAVPVYYPRQSCTKIAVTECIRFGGQQRIAARVYL